MKKDKKEFIFTPYWYTKVKLMIKKDFEYIMKSGTVGKHSKVVFFLFSSDFEEEKIKYIVKTAIYPDGKRYIIHNYKTIKFLEKINKEKLINIPAVNLIENSFILEEYINGEKTKNIEHYIKTIKYLNMFGPFKRESVKGIPILKIEDIKKEVFRKYFFSKNKIRNIFKKLYYDKKFYLSHGDLWGNIIIKKKKFYVIDWEFSAIINFKFYDIIDTLVYYLMDKFKLPYFEAKRYPVLLNYIKKINLSDKLEDVGIKRENFLEIYKTYLLLNFYLRVNISFDPAKEINEFCLMANSLLI